MKPTLYLLHGALGNHEQVEFLKDHLQSYFHISSYTFPGHLFEKPSAFTINELRDDLLERMGNSTAGIFGYSMGGYVALKAAQKAPSQISSIVTLGTKFNWDRESVTKEIEMLNPDIIESKVPHYAESLARKFGNPQWKTTVLNTAAMMSKLSMEEKFSENELQNIGVPTRILRGDNDRMVRSGESRIVQSLLPNCSYREITNSEHPLHLVDKNELVREIIEFTSNPENPQYL